ncbi:MAG: hypothetical protein JWM96_1379 [Alphaproteobacteria bacterium]|nr:hypothetical protein [Alphaproteobacteria bacterium]
MSTVSDVLHVAVVAAARPYIGKAGADALGTVLTAAGEIARTQTSSSSKGTKRN